VIVSILPQAYFVERVGGEYVQVEVLVSPAQSPATYEPTPKQLAALSTADLYVCIGVPFERSLQDHIHSSFPELPILESSLAGSSAADRAHLTQDSHEHPAGTTDPHIWLDPQYVERHAAALCTELSRLDQDHAPEFHTNLESFQRDLAALDNRIAVLLAPFAGRRFFVFHPAYSSFARRYGLEQVAIEIDGKEPSARQLARVLDQARHSGITCIFVQPQFRSPSVRTTAREIGAELVQLDPLAPDYMTNLEQMARTIASSLDQ